MSTTPDFAAGQRWRCSGRTAAETPTLLINRVDRHPLGGEIFHVTVRDVRIRHPGLPSGVLTELPHLPVTRPTLEASAIAFAGEQQADPAYLKGYGEWKQAFDAGKAGSFGVSLAEVLNIVEQGLTGKAPR
ncbi:MAG TPA: hypothetical protein VIT62_11035 [Lysobacter sp.]|jgi:hypothetical protein